MQAVGEKSRRIVRTGLARRRWVLPRSVGRVAGALALDAGILTGHGDVTGVCGVVPVDCESAEEGNSPVDGDGI